jgi:glyoxylase-like metal-dependent hydrolase (beta-lactamase superfamily II)
MSTPNVTAFFDEATNTVTYVVADTDSNKCVVIDPVLDYNAASGRTSTESVTAVIDFIKQENLSLEWILETHVHADHLSGAPVLKSETKAKTAVGSDITAVQSVFKGIFNLKDLSTDGSQFDQLFNDGDEFQVGEITGRVMHTPGHTPACITFVIGDAVFVGDTLFMPDFGTARCDFPGGDAGTLYDSIQNILALPDDTRLFMCHDYKAPGRDEFAWETSVSEQREKNIHIHEGTTREQFVEFRNGRDANLGMPKLIIPSIQMNIRAGEDPEPEDNGVRYLKVPLNQL